MPHFRVVTNSGPQVDALAMQVEVTQGHESMHSLCAAKLSREVTLVMLLVRSYGAREGSAPYLFACLDRGAYPMQHCPEEVSECMAGVSEATDYCYPRAGDMQMRRDLHSSTIGMKILRGAEGWEKSWV